MHTPHTPASPLLHSYHCNLVQTSLACTVPTMWPLSVTTHYCVQRAREHEQKTLVFFCAQLTDRKDEKNQEGIWNLNWHNVVNWWMCDPLLFFFYTLHTRNKVNFENNCLIKVDEVSFEFSTKNKFNDLITTCLQFTACSGGWVDTVYQGFLLCVISVFQGNYGNLWPTVWFYCVCKKKNQTAAAYSWSMFHTRSVFEARIYTSSTEMSAIFG